MKTKNPKKIIKADGSEWFFCPDCKDYRPKSEFSPWKKREVASYCKTHANVRQKKRNHQYYLDHKDEIRKQQEQYRIKTGRTKGGSTAPIKTKHRQHDGKEDK